MDYTDLFRDIWEINEEEMASRNSEDYELDPAQFQKYRAICAVLTKAVKETNGRVEPIRIAPAEEHCGITVYAPLYYFHGNEVLRLAKALQGVSGISIDATVDGEVCISVTVPHVFRKSNRTL